ncbi:MAG: hypothetical protein KDJ43_06105 [Rhizobiaceae bacterium]|nr:hypothetical protein [Rhizobiaceae bacterium]
MDIQVTTPPDPAALGLVWGADEIAKAINRPVRATYHMLENGVLPGASKVGGRWCFAPAIFYQAVAA